MQAPGGMAMGQMMPQMGGGGQPAGGPGPADLLAQLAAMPPKQAQMLVQMNMARAQQQGNQQEFALWQQVMQALDGAGMGGGGAAQGNIVSQTLGAGYGG